MMARDYTGQLLPLSESFAFRDEYERTIRTVLIVLQVILKASVPALAGVIGLVIEFLDRACTSPD